MLRLSLIILLWLSACSQNYSEKGVDAALREKGFTRIPSPDSRISQDPQQVGRSPVVSWGGLMASVPEEWNAQPPSSSMRLAEYRLPADDLGDAELAVFAGIGGSLDENIKRWYGQFTQPDGSATSEVSRRWEVDAAIGIKATLVDITGTFNGGMGPQVGQTTRDHRMLTAVVEAGGIVYHMKLTGTRTSVGRWASVFEDLVAGLTLSE